MAGDECPRPREVSYREGIRGTEHRAKYAVRTDEGRRTTDDRRRRTID